MNTFRKNLFAITVGVLLAGATALADFAGSSGWRMDSTLVGTWQFEMTVRADASDCTTATPIPFGPNPFPALVSFHEGGTLNEYASRSSPSIRSTGFGSWEQSGRHRYDARYTFMEFDANGLLWRTMVIKSNIRLENNGEQYTAVSRLELTDVSGNVLNFCATANGARFTS